MFTLQEAFSISSFRQQRKSSLLLAFDASWCSQTRSGGWAVVIQSKHMGTRLESGFLPLCSNPLAAEAFAMKEAVHLLEKEGIDVSAALITDCKSLVDLVASRNHRESAPDINQVISFLDGRTNIKLLYINRKCRRMRLAHHLANAKRLEAELLRFSKQKMHFLAI